MTFERINQILVLLIVFFSKIVVQRLLYDFFIKFGSIERLSVLRDFDDRACVIKYALVKLIYTLLRCVAAPRFECNVVAFKAAQYLFIKTALKHNDIKLLFAVLTADNRIALILSAGVENVRRE